MSWTVATQSCTNTISQYILTYTVPAGYGLNLDTESAATNYLYFSVSSLNRRGNVVIKVLSRKSPLFISAGAVRLCRNYVRVVYLLVMIFLIKAVCVMIQTLLIENANVRSI